MKSIWQKYGWIAATLIGSAIFSLGFSLFLLPHDMNAGGISGLAMVFVEVFGIGSVGLISIIINIHFRRINSNYNTLFNKFHLQKNPQ